MIADQAIRGITHDDVVAMARAQAERQEPMGHHFEAGTTQACTYERAYLERQRELDEHQG
ncbi:MAG: hypothetical protein JWQ03_628 [Variovorax sp.]|nr:hypothetical protein [Variovorax sp.]